ncbi:MAG: hypothetical protein PPP58_01795 [Natronomonas sp.]
MIDSHRDTRRHVELYRRVAHERPDRVPTAVRRLEELVYDGVIDGYTCRVWPRAVCLDPAESGELTETVAAIRAFAERNDVDLAPAFVTRRRSRSGNEGRAVLRLPASCLLVYEDGELTEIFPRGRSGMRTIEDGLAELEDRVGVVNETEPAVIGN